MMEPTKHRYVSVKSTLPLVPYPPHASRAPITTPRLTLRPFLDTDLPSFFALRSSSEAMSFTARGTPDADIEETKKVLARYLPPNDRDTYVLAIFERETGRFIGMGGSLSREDELGWPGIGYALFPDVWGRGYASEFIKAFMEVWWGLERGATIVRAEAMSLMGQGEVVDGGVAQEVMVAIAQGRNIASGKVLGKVGFVKVAEWIAEKLDGSGLVTLFVFACPRPE